MIKSVFKLIAFLSLAGMLWAVGSGRSFARDFETYQNSSDNSPVDLIWLFPGESRTIPFQYDDIFWNPDCCHVAIVLLLNYGDNISRQLTVNITPVGEVGSELAYVTGGVSFNPFDVLSPKLIFANNDVNYTVEANLFTVVFILSAAMLESSYIDFPIDMAMTLTISN